MEEKTAEEKAETSKRTITIIAIVVGIFFVIAFVCSCCITSIGGNPVLSETDVIQDEPQQESELEQEITEKSIEETRKEDEKKREEAEREQWENEVDIYFSKVTSITEVTSPAFGEIGTLLTEKFATYSWSDGDVLALVLNMEIIRGGYADAKAMSVPTHLESIHDKFVRAMALYSNAMDDLTDGIDGLETNPATASNYLSSANDKITRGTTLITETTVEIVTFKEKYNID